MQISNPSLSQLVGNSFNRNQQPDRYPVRPVTIEGQLVDDDQKKKTQKLAQEDSGNETSSQFTVGSDENSNDTQALIKPVQESNAASSIQILESQQPQNPTVLQSNANVSANEQGFPFGNRRSYQGLAGSSLIIQNYMNNSPSSAVDVSGQLDLFV